MQAGSRKRGDTCGVPLECAAGGEAAHAPRPPLPPACSWTFLDKLPLNRPQPPPACRASPPVHREPLNTRRSRLGPHPLVPCSFQPPECAYRQQSQQALLAGLGRQQRGTPADDPVCSGPEPRLAVAAAAQELQGLPRMQKQAGLGYGRDSGPRAAASQGSIRPDVRRTPDVWPLRLSAPAAGSPGCSHPKDARDGGATC
jgi:hypothetical protein